MKSFSVEAVTTRLFQTHESLASFIQESLPADFLRDGDILAITSKIVSLSEGQIIDRAQVEALGGKRALIEREADLFLGELGHGCTLTLKHGLMMVSAGIDESNSPGDNYILYPKDPWASAEKIHGELCRAFDLETLGVVLTDSHTVPLRRGVMGLSLAHWGFRGTKDCIGENDLFGRPLKFTHQNMADGLACAAVLSMGEGSESRPLARIRGAGLEYLNGADDSPLRLTPEEDLYFPFFRDALKKS